MWGAVLALVIGLQALHLAPSQTITLVNNAGIPSRTVQRLEQVLTVQANDDLRPIWHTPRIVFGPGGESLILTNAPQISSTLGGYHAAGVGVTPYAVAYVKANGAYWTDLASHELIEMLVNPNGNFRIDGTLAEICDPVYNVTYTIRGVSVSDFVTPAWFRSRSRGPWDFEGILGVPTREFLRRYSS